MRYLGVLVLFFVTTIILSITPPISDALADQPITEKELNAILSIMDAKRLGRHEDVLKIMAREKISRERLQQVLTEIAVVMPHVQIERASPAIEKEILSDEERKEVESARGLAKGYALRYFDRRGGERALARTAELLHKYADRVESTILSQSQAAPGK